MIAVPPIAGPERLTRTQVLMVMLMTTMSALSYFDRTIMSIAGPGIMQEFHISETAMGTVYSAFLLSYTIFMTPGGWLNDLFGPRRVLAVAALSGALLTGLTALCGMPGLGVTLAIVPSFLIIRLLFGISAAPVYPACARLTANWIPITGHGWVQALVLAGAAWGAALSPILFSRLIAAFGWRVSFALAAAATAVLALAWFWFVRDHPAAETGQTVRPIVTRNWSRLLTNKNLLVLTFGYFLLNYFEYIFFYWIYYYFGQVLHLGADETAVATTILFLAMAVMTPLGGKISDRLAARYGPKTGRRAVAMAGMGISAVLLYLGASGFGVTATVALLSLAFGCATAAEGPYWAAAIEISGEQAGAGSGLFNAVGNVGGMLAPVLTPMIASRFGWSAGLYCGSLLVLAGMLSWLWVKPDLNATR